MLDHTLAVHLNMVESGSGIGTGGSGGEICRDVLCGRREDSGGFY